tara:strand:- start:34287 stop:34553 length:267 start_codon:yes stop_codon:yes gene_type:complete
MNLGTIAFVGLAILVLIIIVLLARTKTRDEPLSSKWSAAIIEPRAHEDLKYVLHKFREKLDDDIEIILFYGKGRTEFVLDAIKLDGGK